MSSWGISRFFQPKPPHEKGYNKKRPRSNNNSETNNNNNNKDEENQNVEKESDAIVLVIDDDDEDATQKEIENEAGVVVIIDDTFVSSLTETATCPAKAASPSVQQDTKAKALTAICNNISETHKETHTFTTSSCADIQTLEAAPLDSNKDKVVPPAASNPFHMFAASSSSSSAAAVASSSFQPTRSVTTSIPWIQHTAKANKKPKPAPTDKPATAADTKAKPKKKSTDWIKMRDLPAKEQARVVEKWHSMVIVPQQEEDDDDDYCNASTTAVNATTTPTVHAGETTENARFQILVAARLHARCQEPMVRKALYALSQVLQDKRLTVASMAVADPNDLVAALSCLQYYNVKAKHLVRAAQEIQAQFGGTVPEDEPQLKQLTGIGPVMGDLLAFCNTRAMHQERRQRQQAA